MTSAAIRCSVLVAFLMAPGAAALAQQGDAAGDDAGPTESRELREQMQHYFQNRLRAELALSDDQMGEIVPRIQQIEHSRAAAGRDRRGTVRSLQRGLREGASDAELQGLLDRQDRIELEQRELERRTRQEIEERLSVRQRVQFRFFIERFRREMQRRIQNLRGGDREFGPPGRESRPERP